MVMQTLELWHLMVFGVFRKIIWSRGHSKKFIGEKIFGNCGAGKLKYYTLCLFYNSAKEFKYDTRIANLKGRKLVTYAYEDPPLVYMDRDKTVNEDSAEFTVDIQGKKMWKSLINNELQIIKKGTRYWTKEGLILTRG